MGKRDQRAPVKDNAYEYQKTEFGRVVSSFDVIKADKENFATVFAEGSHALKGLLLHMWDNNIETLACCTGHAGVPYYTKDTLFGQKEVDRQTYHEHYGSSRYHCYTRDRAGYFSVKLDADPDKIREMSQDLKQLLAQVKPALDCHVTHGNGVLGIHLNHYVRESEVERFFSSADSALSETLGIDQKDKNLQAGIENNGRTTAATDKASPSRSMSMADYKSQIAMKREKEGTVAAQVGRSVQQKVTSVGRER